MQRKLLIIAGLAGLFLTGYAHAAEPVTIGLAGAGRAEVPIVIAPGAPEARRQLAGELADYLQRISGGEFPVIEGDGRTGLALGTAAEFPALAAGQVLADEGFGAEEHYLLRSHRQGLHAIGATDLAVQHAAWDLLYRLGCRWFFPGPKWEIVPRLPDLAIAVDAHERPDYATRRISCSYGTWEGNAEWYPKWQLRNRAASAFELRTGHAYEAIIRQFEAEFRAHPEYMGLYEGRRDSTKLCVGNADLRKLVVRYAIDYFHKNPEAVSVSVDPSDGGRWCECEACAAIGSPSNRALTLANDVSAVLEESFPGKYVGMYAYNMHSPPPTIRARPRVIVSCATSFLKGGLSIEQVIAGWKAQGVRQFGIREYYSVNTWDRDLPHNADGGDLAYLAGSIPQFHAQGAKFLISEASENWGPNGLGYYVAARILWDVDEAERIEELIDDFLDKAFGPARRPMADFYRLLNGPQRPLMSRDLIGRMYRLLGEAALLAADPAIRARIDDLVLYTRYVELFRAYDNASGPRRQEAFEAVIRHAYRMRGTMMVHSKALYRDLPSRDKSVTVPPEAVWKVPDGKNPWKSSEPWTREQLDRLLAEGAARNPVVDQEPVRYSADLVPCSPLGGAGLPMLEDPCIGRSRRDFFTWFEQAPARLVLAVTGGLIPHYRDRGNVRLDLFALSAGREQLVGHDESAPPDGMQRRVTLQSDRSGLHKLAINDGKDMTQIVWPEGLPRTVEVGAETSPRFAGRRSGYFYVPRGTAAVVGYASNERGAFIHDGGGEVVFRFAELDGPDHFSVAVPAGQDGTFWSFHDLSGRLVLLSVPPYTAPHPTLLLLPREVVAADAAR